MGNSAYIKSIESLEQFRVALKRYRSNVIESFGSVDMKVRAALSRLQNREQYWRSKLTVQTERGPVINKTAEAELHKIQSKTAKVEAAYSAYQKEVRQLKAVFDNEVTKGVSLLERSILLLTQYLNNNTLTLVNETAIHNINTNSDPLIDIKAFEWDKGNKQHIGPKFVTPYETMDIFFDKNKVVYEDKKHADYEERYIILGKTQEGRLLFQVFTRRGDNIRVISSRDINEKEVGLYEERIDHP